MQHPVRVEEEREGGTGPRGRGRGGERPPGVAVWVAEGIIRVVLGVARGASRVSNYGLECDVMIERKAFVKWYAF